MRRARASRACGARARDNNTTRTDSEQVRGLGEAAHGRVAFLDGDDDAAVRPVHAGRVQPVALAKHLLAVREAPHRHAVGALLDVIGPRGGVLVAAGLREDAVRLVPAHAAVDLEVVHRDGHVGRRAAVDALLAVDRDRAAAQLEHAVVERAVALRVLDDDVEVRREVVEDRLLAVDLEPEQTVEELGHELQRAAAAELLRAEPLDVDADEVEPHARGDERVALRDERARRGLDGVGVAHRRVVVVVRAVAAAAGRGRLDEGAQVVAHAVEHVVVVVEVDADEARVRRDEPDDRARLDIHQATA